MADHGIARDQLRAFIERIAINARDTRSAIGTAHEALDFIEGQIS